MSPNQWQRCNRTLWLAAGVSNNSKRYGTPPLP